MSATLPADVEVSIDPKLDEAPDPGDVDHVVCCRDFFQPAPYVAMCGVLATDKDFVAFTDQVCAPCVLACSRRLRDLGVLSEGENLADLKSERCVKDGSPCPVDGESDRLDRKLVGLE